MGDSLPNEPKPTGMDAANLSNRMNFGVTPGLVFSEGVGVGSNPGFGFPRFHCHLLQSD